jgi:hypothetical protein
MLECRGRCRSSSDASQIELMVTSLEHYRLLIDGKPELNSHECSCTQSMAIRNTCRTRSLTALGFLDQAIFLKAAIHRTLPQKKREGSFFEKSPRIYLLSRESSRRSVTMYHRYES